jgi:cytochrome oxidase assembly protein ShyY1
LSRLRLDVEWRLALFTALLFPVLVGLGFWQLQRASEKEQLATDFASRALQPPQPLAALAAIDSPADLAYRRVEVSGYFHPEVTLLKDNQLRDGRYGVDVLGLFFDRSTQSWVVLNRGWIAADPARRSLPEVAIPPADQRLEASIYVPPGQPYVLGEQRLDALRWPLLVADPVAPPLRRVLENALGGEVYPYELRLADGQPGGLRRDWPLVNSSPQRHRGYALQWFTMAGVLLLLFVLRSSNIADLLRPNRGSRN